MEMFVIVTLNGVRVNGTLLDGSDNPVPEDLDSLKNYAFSVIEEKTEPSINSNQESAMVHVKRHLIQYDDYEEITRDAQLEKGGKIYVDVQFSNTEVFPSDKLVLVEVEQTETSMDVSCNSLSTSDATEQSPKVSTPKHGKAGNSLAVAGCTPNSVPQNKLKYLFNDCEAYDIDEIIQSVCESERTMILSRFTDELQSKPCFTLARQALASACGRELLRKANLAGQEKPTAVQKAKMAFSIWLKFPFYEQAKKLFPYGKMYDPMTNSGFLENFTVNQVRTNKRKREKFEAVENGSVAKKVTKTANPVPVEPLMDADTAEMKLRELSRGAPEGRPVIDRNEIILKMKELYEYRRYWIDNDTSVTPAKIVAKYPCLMTMPEVLTLEFETMTCDLINEYLPDMDFRWSEASEFIIDELISRPNRNAMQQNIMEAFGVATLDEARALDSESKSNMALQFLPIILKPVSHNTGRGKRPDRVPIPSAISHLIQHWKVVSNRPIRSIIDECKKDKSLTQPFLIAFTENGGKGEKAAQIFLVIDYNVMEIPDASYIKAVKYLFASFFVFNTNFPEESLGQVYEFFEYLFLIKNSKRSKSKSKTKAKCAMDLADRAQHYITSKIENGN